MKRVAIVDFELWEWSSFFMDLVVVDKIRGVIFGQAIGDALGFGTEWVPKSRVREEYPNGLRSYSQIVRYHNLKKAEA